MVHQSLVLWYFRNLNNPVRPAHFHAKLFRNFRYTGSWGPREMFPAEMGTYFPTWKIVGEPLEPEVGFSLEIPSDEKIQIPQVFIPMEFSPNSLGSQVRKIPRKSRKSKKNFFHWSTEIFWNFPDKGILLDILFFFTKISRWLILPFESGGDLFLFY